jgi:hypothetical protein
MSRVFSSAADSLRQNDDGTIIKYANLLLARNEVGLDTDGKNAVLLDPRQNLI